MLPSQSNYGYERRQRAELRVISPVWGFFNESQNLDTWLPHPNVPNLGTMAGHKPGQANRLSMSRKVKEQKQHSGDT